MVDIPIIVSTPGLHTHAASQPPEYPFGQCSSTRPSPLTIRPKVISHATQTDIEDDPPVSARRQSPINSRSSSRSRNPIHQAWTEPIHLRLSSPHSHHHHQGAVDLSGRPLLNAPGIETPKRPATPRADLYKGQAEENFGMTFERKEDIHMRKAKPTPCAFSYEDQKHRMTMDWLERRGTW